VKYKQEENGSNYEWYREQRPHRRMAGPFSEDHTLCACSGLWLVLVLSSIFPSTSSAVVVHIVCCCVPTAFSRQSCAGGSGCYLDEQDDKPAGNDHMIVVLSACFIEKRIRERCSLGYPQHYYHLGSARAQKTPTETTTRKRTNAEHHEQDRQPDYNNN